MLSLHDVNSIVGDILFRCATSGVKYLVLLEVVILRSKHLAERACVFYPDGCVESEALGRK